MADCFSSMDHHATLVISKDGMTTKWDPDAIQQFVSEEVTKTKATMVRAFALKNNSTSSLLIDLCVV